MIGALPESFTDALVACVQAAGGSKRVGPAIWPEKTIEGAQRHLINCLKDERAERLTPDQVLLIMRLAHRAGCHTAMAYLADAVGYAPPVPVEAVDEHAELQRQFVQAMASLEQITKKLEASGSRLYAPLRAA